MKHSLTATSFLTVLLILSAAGSRAHGQQVLRTDEERERGIELYKKNDFKSASRELQSAVQKNKNDVQAWYYLGLSLTHTGNPKEASKAYETALVLQPNFASARAGLAFTFLLRNKLNDAQRQAERTLQIDQKSVDAHYILGVVRLRSGDHASAVRQANATIELDPKFAPAYLLKAQGLLTFFEETEVGPPDEQTATRLARYKEAAESLKEYLHLNPASKNATTWADQLEALQFSIDMLEHKASGQETFGAKEVTTRARVLKKPEPQYTQQARMNGVTGTVILRAVFAADGLVKHIMVLRGLPDGLTEASIDAARKIKFVAATKDGKPVSMWMQLEYNFNLF